jgi:bacterioferritin
VKGSPKVIAALQAACAAEVRSQVQYRQDAAVLDNAGLPALAAELLKRADEEAEHLKLFTERLVFLDGKPVIAPDPTNYSGDIQPVLDGQLKLETKASSDYQGFADLAAAEGDAVTRDLFAEIEADEQEHINYLEGEINVIAKWGIDAYVAGYRAKG